MEKELACPNVPQMGSTSVYCDSKKHRNSGWGPPAWSRPERPAAPTVKQLPVSPQRTPPGHIHRNPSPRSPINHLIPMHFCQDSQGCTDRGSWLQPLKAARSRGNSLPGSLLLLESSVSAVQTAEAESQPRAPGPRTCLHTA